MRFHIEYQSLSALLLQYTSQVVPGMKVIFITSSPALYGCYFRIIFILFNLSTCYLVLGSSLNLFFRRYKGYVFEAVVLHALNNFISNSA